jgi:hypothetical protein
MEAPAVLTNTKPIEYGLGLQPRKWRGTREIAHSGATGGYRAYAARYPDQKLSVAALCNDGNANAAAVARDAANEMMKLEDVTRSRVTLSAEQLSSRVGLYRDMRTDAVLRVFLRDGALRLGFADSGPELVPISADRFRLGDGELTFNDSTVHLSFFGYDTDYVRVAAATDVKFADYAGEYWSDEANALYRVKATAKGLEASLPAMDAQRLEPTYVDGFRVGSGTLIRFTRDASGRVNGFDLKNDFGMASGTARVERIHFVRR